MNSATHIETVVLPLKSNLFFGDLIPPDMLADQLGDFVEAGAMVDLCKKALFYGKTKPELAKLVEQYADDSEAFCYSDGGPDSEPNDLLHGLLGIATEAAELSELMLNADPEGIDDTKLLDELGDLMWYVHLVLAATDMTMGEVLAANAAKLKARFGDKFSQDKAINRDVQNEDKAIRAM